jgi:hypothetical protein
MGILNELHDIVHEDDSPIEKLLSKVGEKEEGASIDDLIKHIKAVTDAAVYIDMLTKDSPNSEAFDAEIALRKAIEKMQKLADETYEKNSDEEENEEDIKKELEKDAEPELEIGNEE